MSHLDGGPYCRTEPRAAKKDWAAVTAEVISTKRVLSTFNKAGLTLLSDLKEIKMEPCPTTQVPQARKPNSRYYVDILMPREWEMNPDLLAAAICTFHTIETIEYTTRNRPLGSKRLFRLTFKTVTAPREVFTKEDPNVRIRERVLSCGVMAQVIHKWSRLNALPQPSVARNMQPRGSYASTARSQEGQQAVTPRPPTPAARPAQAPKGPPNPSVTANVVVITTDTPQQQPRETPALKTLAPSNEEKCPTAETANDHMEVDTTMSVPAIQTTVAATLASASPSVRAMGPLPAYRPTGQNGQTAPSPRSMKARTDTVSDKPTRSDNNVNRFNALCNLELDNFDDDDSFTQIAAQL